MERTPRRPMPRPVLERVAANVRVTPQVASFSLAQAMSELNAMRIATPAQDLTLRFLAGERTWEQIAAAPTAEQSWKVTLPTLTTGVNLPAGAQTAGTGEGVLQALKYLVKKKR